MDFGFWVQVFGFRVCRGSCRLYRNLGRVFAAANESLLSVTGASLSKNRGLLLKGPFWTIQLWSASHVLVKVLYDVAVWVSSPGVSI